jgi:hypothetical protein
MKHPTQFLFLITLLAILPLKWTPAFAEERKTVVVGAVGEDPKPGLRKALETQIQAAFVRDGRFTAVTREEAVLTILDSEHIYQRSGAVDDRQIRQIGIRSGARYVCVVKISAMMDSYMLSAQFVDIESANIIAMSSVPSALRSSGDFLAASEALVLGLLGARAAGGGQSNYGNGVFMEDNKSANPVSERLEKILKSRIAVSDGTCLGGVTVTVESPPEPTCAEGMVGVVCRANVSLVITRCKGGRRTVLTGSVIGSDRNSAATARRQFERNMETAQFWGDWVKELERWVK